MGRWEREREREEMRKKAEEKQEQKEKQKEGDAIKVSPSTVVVQTARLILDTVCVLYS